jgi:hypothetical protein
MLELNGEHFNDVTVSRKQDNWILTDVTEVPVEQHLGRAIRIVEQYEVDLRFIVGDQLVLIMGSVAAR